MARSTIAAPVQPVKTHASSTFRPSRTRPGAGWLAACLVAVGALVLLPACGGGGDDQGGQEGGAETNASSAVLSKCDKNGESCTEIPEDCPDDPECLEDECAPESGGCEALLLPTRPGVFGTSDELRLCFDLRVQEGSGEPVTDSTPVTTGETETGETDAPPADAISTVECSGSSYPIKGLDPSAIEGELESTADGQLVWFQDSALLVTFADGAFTVSEQP